MFKKTKVLERIAEAIEKNNDIAERVLDLHRVNLTTNDMHLQNNRRSINMQIAANLSNLAPTLGDNTIAFIDAVQMGELDKAYELTKPQKKTRKTKTEVEVKPKTARTNKKSSTNEN